MKQKKENSVALLLHWAGEQKFWLFLAILLSMCSGLCIIIPYIGIYRLMDATFILLLDEATASLDIENELAVKQAIANLLKEKKTVVMIAHTLSIVKNADQILVMGDGQIAESGTHEELLAKGGKYAAMWNAEQKISA